MLLKVKQHNLKTYINKESNLINILKIRMYKHLIKCLAVLASFLFSLNVFATGDLLGCNDKHNWESYNQLHRMIRESSDIVKDIDLVYNLAIVSLCLGETDEGMVHLQKASDTRHIPATLLLGYYYRYDHTFSSSEHINDLETLNKAIHYYKTGIQMIEHLPNYPEGSTDDMEYIEYAAPTSLYLFTGLPFLYSRGYFIAIHNIINDIEEKEVFYNDTLEVLNKMREVVIQCLNRPALSVWKEKRETVYEAQQIKCSAYLEFVEEVYPLEQQRLQADQNCQLPLKDCIEHKEIVDKIYQSAKDMFHQIDSAPTI